MFDKSFIELTISLSKQQQAISKLLIAQGNIMNKCIELRTQGELSDNELLEICKNSSDIFADIIMKEWFIMYNLTMLSS